MRNRAINMLEDELSENTLRHIREIDYLEDWIVNAMINFHKSEVEKLNIQPVSDCEAKRKITSWPGRPNPEDVNPYDTNAIKRTRRKWM